MTKKTISILLPILVLILAMVIVAIMFFTSTPPTVKEVGEKVWNVTVLQAQPGSYQPEIVLYGRVESPRETIIRAAIEADVIKTPFLDGAHISKNEVLIYLDDTEARLLLQQRESEVKALQSQIASEKNRYATDLESIEHEKKLVESAERQVKRLFSLYQKQAGSEVAYDDAVEELNQQRLTLRRRELDIKDHDNRMANLTAQLLRAQALLARAQLDVDRTQVVAPFTGRVADLKVAVGNRVRSGDQLIELFDTDALEVRAQVPAQYVAELSIALKNKQKITAYTILDNNKKIQFVCDRLSAKVESGRTGIDAFFKVLNYNDLIPLGATFELNVQLPAANHLIPLPISAIYGLDRVYLVENDRLQAVAVTKVGNYTTADGANWVLVKSEKIKTGNQIVVNQLPNAITGLRVKVVHEQN